MTVRIFAQDVLESINLGSEQGNADHDRYFVASAAWHDLVHDEVDLILGRKGTGKTKMYRHLQQQSMTFERSFDGTKREVPTTVIPLVSSHLDEHFQQLLDLAGNDENLLKTAWLLQISGVASVIALKDRIEDKATSNREKENYRSLRDLLYEYGEYGGSTIPMLARMNNVDLRRGMWDVVKTRVGDLKKMRLTPVVGTSPGGEPTISVDVRVVETPQERRLRDHAARLTETLMAVLADRGERIWVAVDSLDELLYGMSHENSSAVIRSLLRVIIDLREIADSVMHGRSDTLRLKVFAREDVFQRITLESTFPASTAIPTAYISWSKREAAKMVAERILASEKARAFYGGITVRDIENDPERFLGRVLEGREDRSPFSRVVEATSDASTSVSPRNLIGCLKRAFDISREEHHLGEKYGSFTALVTKSNLDRAKVETSTARLKDTVIAEYPMLSPFIDRLHGAPHTYFHQEMMSNQLDIVEPELEDFLWWSELSGLTYREGRQIRVASVYRHALKSTTSAASEAD